MDPSGSKGATPPQTHHFGYQQPEMPPPHQPFYAQPSGAPPPQPIYNQHSGTPLPQPIYNQHSGTSPIYEQNAAPPSYAEALTYATPTGITYPGQTMGSGGQPTTSQPNAYGQPILTQPMTNAYGQPMVLQNQDGQALYAYATTIVQVNPNSPEMNENPIKTKCPNCQAEITTSIEYVVGTYTILCCVMFFAFGYVLTISSLNTRDMEYLCMTQNANYKY